MIYIVYSTKTNRVIQTYSKKPGVSGDRAIAEVAQLPEYDSSIEYLKVSNTRTAYETYTKKINKIDEQGNICVDAETYEPIMVEVAETRAYITCDFIVEQDLKKIYQRELAQLHTWFDDFYDKQVNEYARCKRLGVPYDNKYGTIESLDLQAEVKSKRIKELEQLITQIN